MLLCLAASLALTQDSPQAAATPRPIEVRVDARIELVTTVARLAGFAEFDMPNSRSPYAERVQARFGPLLGHAAVSTLQRLRAERGVSHDALVGFALHVGPLPALDERIAFDRPPERLDARWDGAHAREFLGQLREFARESRAAEFFESERPFFAQVEQRLHARLSTSKALPWFDSYFGARGTAQYTAVPGLLCGGGNFGVGVRFPDDRPEEITPVFGCWTWDDAGLPIFGDAYLPLLIHELCHTYTNPLVDRFESELAPALQRIHATCAQAMARQSYPTWKIVAYESIVRASVVRCRLATEGLQTANEQAQSDVKLHFAWVPELARTLEAFESARAQYATFADFMPRVVAFFDDYAAALPESAARPKLASSVPANGALGVDPALGAMVLTFDRPMKDKSWSIVGSRRDQPEITGALTYDAQRKVLTIPVRLEASRTYRFSLNSAEFTGFQSESGVALSPVEITFTTRAP
jgi:hypothetical protein